MSGPAVGRSALATAVLVRLGEMTNRTFVLPMVVFYPTSRCNSRCVSCDWWKSSGADDLGLDEIARLAAGLPDLGTKLVVFSGGEPLLRPDVFAAARAFRGHGITLHLLTSGVLLDRCAAEVAQTFARVTVSLDAPSEALYATIRGVRALDRIERGVARLRRLAPQVPVTARATVHRLNFRELPRLIDHAKAMGLDGISFLPADLSSAAFGRARHQAVPGLAPDCRELAELGGVIEATITEYSREFETGFIREPPAKLRRIRQYYAALAGGEPFPQTACNAPWVSVVVEANGAVRPCFFHRVVGNVRQQPLAAIVADNLPSFRGLLDCAQDPVCARCVCSLRTGWRSAPWQ
jgi:MoaA/NifB/PqqE/SkfB family radical SAM enzyme